MSTTDHASRLIGRLGLKNHRWVRVDIGDLGGADPHRVLVGSVDPQITLGQADSTGKVGDLIGTYWAELFLVNRAFVELLTVSGLTGWRTTSVPVQGNPSVDDVCLLRVVGSCGPIRETGAGRVLELDSWDGADLFVPSNESTILLSSRAVEALRDAHLSNVEVEPAGVELGA